MFRTKKTREAVCYLLKGLGGKSTYGAITKLLYIADRESMRKQSRPITGDLMCALPHGPILSVVLDRLNGSHPEFSDLIVNGKNYEIHLVGEEDPHDLTFSDLAVLKTVLDTYGKLSWESLKAETHTFDEWKRYDKGPDTWSLISAEDVAEALGFSPEQKEALVKNMEERNSIASFFSTLGEPAVAAV